LELLYLVCTILAVILAALLALVPFLLMLAATEFLLRLLEFGRLPRFALMVFKSVRRNPLRTSLTYLATFVLVVVVVMVWSTLYYLDGLVAEKGKNLKLVVTDRWQVLSEMPFSYADLLCRGAAERPSDVVPNDAMTWQFYFGTLDPQKSTPENQLIVIALAPPSLRTMMAELIEELSPSQGRSGSPAERRAALAEAAHRMEDNPRAILVGARRLQVINKRVGERIQVTGVNYKDINLEFEIAGALPPGPFDQIVVMNRDYLNAAIDSYPKTHGHMKHPLAARSLNRVLLEVPDKESAGRVVEQVESSTAFRNPTVKCETMSSDIATKLDLFRDLLWGLRWLVSPTVVATMVLVISNAISISVRERRSEIAMLKVLGFRPAQLLGIVIGEGVLIGAASGLFACALAYMLVNAALNSGVSLPLYVPFHAFWWGPLLGALAAIFGSLLPAWSAANVNVAEVFSKVA
jgi:putative ABC transport system permease protein